MNKLAKKKKYSDKILLISIGVIVILFGVLLYSISKNNVPTQESVTYKGYEFVKIGNIWQASLIIGNDEQGWQKQYDILFHYNPFEVENIETMTSSGDSSASRSLLLPLNKTYITTDPDYPASVVLSGVEIAKVLGQIYGKNVSSAVIREDNRTESPVATCENATINTGIIYLRLSNETRVYNQGTCVIVEGTNPAELLKASEKLAYELLTVI